MQVQLKSILIEDNKKQPFFKLQSTMTTFRKDAIVMKVLSFSIDPVMRVWLAGAKTNFRTVRAGDTFNCFGVGQIVQSQNEDYPVGSYLFGNTGTTNYLQLTQQKMLQCFPIDQELVKKWGPFTFLYLINNGLAAYQGLQILAVKPGDKVVVSTAAGATGLLLCHLLKKRQVQIIGLCSEQKKELVSKYTDNLVDYRDTVSLRDKLKKAHFNKYFDNVGQSLLDVVLETIEPNGVIAACGAIQNYASPKEGGIHNWFQIISKRIKIEGIRFSSLIFRANQIFDEFEHAELMVQVKPMEQFMEMFLELFKRGGSIVGKVVIDPHK